MPNHWRLSEACRIVSQSDLLPRMIATRGLASIIWCFAERILSAGREKCRVRVRGESPQARVFSNLRRKPVQFQPVNRQQAKLSEHRLRILRLGHEGIRPALVGAAHVLSFLRAGQDDDRNAPSLWFGP